jgi:hypothetical protein
VPREGLLAALGLRPATASRPTLRVERTSGARAFNAPLYLLSYLGDLIWRPVRESNPRLPARQAGTASPRMRQPLRAAAWLASAFALASAKAGH